MSSCHSSIGLSNLPLLRGKRTRFAASHDETYDLPSGAGKDSLLYLSEMPDEEVNEVDDDAEWYADFDWNAGGAGEFQGGEVSHQCCSTTWIEKQAALMMVADVLSLLG